MENMSEEQAQKLEDFKKELNDLSEITFNRDDDEQTKIVYLLHEVAKQLIYLNNKVDDMEGILFEILRKK